MYDIFWGLFSFCCCFLFIPDSLVTFIGGMITHKLFSHSSDDMYCLKWCVIHIISWRRSYKKIKETIITLPTDSA